MLGDAAREVSLKDETLSSYKGNAILCWTLPHLSAEMALTYTALDKFGSP
jgi:hypothetical protein